MTPGLTPRDSKRLASSAGCGKRHVGRQDQRLGRAAGEREGDAALHRRIELAARLDVGLGHDGGALALGEGRDLPVGRHDQDASDPLDAGRERVRTSSSMVSTSRRRAASGRAGASRRLARPRAFTGTTANVVALPHRAALALPATATSRSQKARHWRARATLSSSGAHHGVGHYSRHRQVGGQCLVGGVDDEAVDQPLIVPRNGRGCPRRARARP